MKHSPNVIRGQPSGRWFSWLLLIILTLMASLLIYDLWPRAKPPPSPAPVASEPVVDSSPAEAASTPDDQPPLPSYLAIDQAALAQFVADYKTTIAGDFSLMIYDVGRAEQVIAHQPSELYFTGSVYKLYVAFLAWQDVDAGKFDLEEVVVPNHPLYGATTLRDCLYYMIQVSNSLCAETILGRYDRDVATERLRALGLPDVTVVGFLASVEDLQQLLLHIYANEDQVLTAESQQQFLKALVDQRYRKYVIAGFKAVTVQSYNKTGDSFRPGLRVHNDATVLELSDGRTLVLVLFTKDAPQALIIDFSRQLADYLTTTLELPVETSAGVLQLNQ